MSLSKTGFLILDCQTTGLTPAHGHLLEIAWCLVTAGDGDAPEVRSHLVRLPEGETIPGRIKSLTGLRDEDLTDALAPEDVRGELSRFVAGAGLSHCLIHYAQFEKPFLARLFDDGEFPLPILCTHQLAKRLHPTLPTRNIRGLAGYYGTRMGELKRASGHALATAAIWRCLAVDLEKAGLASVERLESWLSEPVDTSVRKKSKYSYPLDKEKRLALPDVPGVYRMLGKNGEILYVGKATSLKSRVNSYFRGKKGRDSRKLEMLTQVWDLRVTTVASPLEAAILENDEIKRHDPPYNVSLKAGRRELLFYSRDFSGVATSQSAAYPIGPFANSGVVDRLCLMAEAVASGEFAENLFHQPLPAEDLSAAFDLFCRRVGVNREACASIRSLLALGARLYRGLPRGDCAADIETGQAREFEADGIESEETQTSLTVDEIAEKYGRLLMRAAKSLLRARTLAALLDSDVEFDISSDGESRALRIRRGQVSGAEPCEGIEAAAAVPTRSDLGWQGLGLETYDRMAVLLSELGRLQARGVAVHARRGNRSGNLPELRRPALIDGISLFTAFREDLW